MHVIDLDGAFAGAPGNFAAVQAIVALGLKVQLGGGLRTRASVERALGLGVHRVVIGTRAAESEEFVAALVQTFGDQIAVGIDAKDGRVAVKGWVDTTTADAIALARRMDALGVRTLIHTDISTDGMLTGPNCGAQEAMLAAVNCRVIASGGVSRREDVERFLEIKKRRPNLDGVIIGKALYEKRVDLGGLLRQWRCEEKIADRGIRECIADQARAVAPPDKDLSNGGRFRISVKSQDEKRTFPVKRLRHSGDGPMGMPFDIDLHQIGQTEPAIGHQFVKADGLNCDRPACRLRRLALVAEMRGRAFKFTVRVQLRWFGPV